MSVGRPSEYSEEIAAEICAEIADGKPLRQFCRERGIAWRTVYDWMTAHPEFSARFAHAREIGHDAISEECMEIADDATNDWMEKRDQEGEPTGHYMLNGDHVQRSKLRIETRLKLLAKWNPKKYGEKVTQEVSGPNGGPLEITEITRKIIK